MKPASLVARRSSLVARRSSLLALIPFLLAGCGPDNPEQSWDRSEAAIRNVPMASPCGSDADCGSGQACFGDPGECLCAAGRTMCPNGCLDLASDNGNCGGCGSRCPRGAGCVDGECEVAGEGPVAAAFLEVPELISAGSPTSECTTTQGAGFNEAYPERTISTPTNRLYAVFNGLNSGPDTADYYNITDNQIDPFWGWIPPERQCDVHPAFETKGDGWASTMPLGREFVSFLVMESAYPNRYCVGIGAPTQTELEQGTNWLQNIRCANSLDWDVDDGPAIHYDLSAPRLWAVATEGTGVGPAPPNYNICGPNSGAGEGVCLYYYSPCNGALPQPNTVGCPRVFEKKVEGEIGGHATVISSPISHNAIVAYRALNGDVRVKIYSPAGVEVAALNVRNVDYGQPASCQACGYAERAGGVPKCGGCNGLDCTFNNSYGCARLVSKVHLAVKHDVQSGRAYLYLAYDQRCTTTNPIDGGLYLKARVDVVDITNEAALARVAGFVSSSCVNSASNEFASNVSAIANTYSGGPNQFAFFYYRQPPVGNPAVPDSCNTIYTGQWADSLVPAALNDFGTISGPFPSVVFQTASGMGDYAAAIRRGTTGYYFYPTWAQPIQTSANCLDCDFNHAGGVEQWNLGVFGARVRP